MPQPTQMKGAIFLAAFGTGFLEADSGTLCLKICTNWVGTICKSEKENVSEKRKKSVDATGGNGGGVNTKNIHKHETSTNSRNVLVEQVVVA